MLLGNKIVVVGLGYVGLPLAVALARHFEVTGFDIDPNRIGELRENFDRTREVDAADLKATTMAITSNVDDISGADVYIVTVPTPVDAANHPDLGAVLSATRMIAAAIDPAKRPTIVYESTVYPGVTEDVCGREIERASGLTRGPDFRLGYSPESFNPCD
jgi:UDP-N-acetyl-D-galactosamine dehydrogenase